MIFLSTRKVFKLTCSLKEKILRSSFCICQRLILDQKSKCYSLHYELLVCFEVEMCPQIKKQMVYANNHLQT